MKPFQRLPLSVLLIVAIAAAQPKQPQQKQANPSHTVPAPLRVLTGWLYQDSPVMKEIDYLNPPDEVFGMTGGGGDIATAFAQGKTSRTQMGTFGGDSLESMMQQSKKPTPLWFVEGKQRFEVLFSPKAQYVGGDLGSPPGEWRIVFSRSTRYRVTGMVQGSRIRVTKLEYLGDGK